MVSNPRPPREPVRITPDDPLGPLHRWLAEGQVDEAARSRSRQRSLERQAAEEANLIGVLVDLAERRRPATITTIGGHRVSGPVVAVGADVAIVHDTRLGATLVPAAAVAVIRPAPGDALPLGDRATNVAGTFADALLDLAADRPGCLIGVLGEQLRGDLRSASREVAVLALDGDRRELVHVAVPAIDHVVVLGR